LKLKNKINNDCYPKKNYFRGAKGVFKGTLRWQEIESDG
jgi:hypothetical protein